MSKLGVINSDGKTAVVLPPPDEISVSLVNLRLKAFAANPYDQLFVELNCVDAAERALESGADALFIDTFGDYAIQRIRAVSPVPVVGAGEAGIAEASLDSRAFSIVTVWPVSMKWLYSEVLSRSPGGNLCQNVHHVSPESELSFLGTDLGVKARMIRGEADIVDEIVKACHKAIETDGSEAILLGCTCMSPIAEKIQQRCSFPVIDASAAGLRSAYSILGQHPPRSDTVETKRAGTANRIVETLLEAEFDRSYEPDDCEVCTVVTSMSG